MSGKENLDSTSKTADSLKEQIQKVVTIQKSQAEKTPPGPQKTAIDQRTATAEKAIDVLNKVTDSVNATAKTFGVTKPAPTASEPAPQAPSRTGPKI